MPWTAIGYVTSGITLVAFMVAAAFTIATRRISSDAENIRSAQPRDRKDLIAAALERWHLPPPPVDRLSGDQVYQLALEQLRERRRRLRINVFTVLALAVLAAVLAGFAISRHQDSPLPTSVGSVVPSAQAGPTSASTATTPTHDTTVADAAPTASTTSSEATSGQPDGSAQQTERAPDCSFPSLQKQARNLPRADKDGANLLNRAAKCKLSEADMSSLRSIILTAAKSR